ncbi:gustatory receptor for sugar taste 64f-like [Anticarsia gemmatalis]|uniref:gustatory receptor for sugar taste 64f-like n=1 Tax=Anticarsia gemmatalis TaxID=129554 RepID=UPI003F762A02
MKVYDIKVKKKPCGLLACLRHAMRLCRWAGYFPVQGLDQRYADGTRFEVKCFYSIFFIATLLGQGIMCCFSIIWFFDSEVTLPTVSSVIFNVTTLIAAILFARLAKQWPTLMKKAEETEQSLTKLKLDNRTVWKSSAVAYIIMILALIEHIMCTNFAARFVMQCLHESTITRNVMEHFFTYRMPYVSKYIAYSPLNIAVTQFFLTQATFIWSFTDVLTICISIYLTSHFDSLNKVISCKKFNNSVSWGQLREHYSKIVVLVKEIDKQLSSFILLSFFTDLFYICQQLFNSLHRNYATIQYCSDSDTNKVLSSPYYLLYYLYSFLFLVLRALSLSLYAANVHAAAQEPIIAVYDVPTSEYNQDVQRFQLQIHCTKIALSGKFFYVTRSMVLQVIGTIITYELVLLQFNTTPGQTMTPVKDNTTSVAH